MMSLLLGLHFAFHLQGQAGQQAAKTPVIIYTGSVRPAEADALVQLEPTAMRRKAASLDYVVLEGHRTITLIPPTLQCPPEMIPVALAEYGFPMQGYVWPMSKMPFEVREGVRAFFDEEFSQPNGLVTDANIAVVFDAGLRIHYRYPHEGVVREFGIRLSCLNDNSLLQSTPSLDDVFMALSSSTPVTKFLSDGDSNFLENQAEAQNAYSHWLKDHWSEKDQGFRKRMGFAISRDPLLRNFPKKAPAQFKDFPPIVSLLIPKEHPSNRQGSQDVSKAASIVEAYWELSMRPAIPNSGRFRMLGSSFVLRRIPYEALMAP